MRAGLDVGAAASPGGSGAGLGPGLSGAAGSGRLLSALPQLSPISYHDIVRAGLPLAVSPG